MEKQKKTVTDVVSSPVNALHASYEVAYLIAKEKKPYTIGEKLLLPAALVMCRAMHGNNVAEKLKAIPLSDTTVSRRISEMSANIQTQLLLRVKSSLFALLLDEATDISKVAHLIAYVSYCYEGAVLEDFLFCREIKSRATASQLFEMLNSYLSTEGLQWDSCIAICTDGAPAMCGGRAGLKAKVLEVAPHIAWTHCMIEVRVFMLEVDAAKAEKLRDARWLVLLAYLADMFEKLNSLNVSLQGANSTSFDMSKKINVFKKKICLWRREIARGSSSPFALLTEAILETEYELSNVVEPITNHLTTLVSSLEKYFPANNSNSDEWVTQPFQVETVPHLPLAAQEQLINLQSEQVLESHFRKICLGELWGKVSADYPDLAACAMRIFLPFSSSYLYEIGFSALAVLKTKYRSRMEVEDNLRVAVAKIHPDIVFLAAQKQTHPSH